MGVLPDCEGRSSRRPSTLAITPREPSCLTPSRRSRLQRLAREDDLPRFSYPPGLRSGTSSFPALVLADSSGISLRSRGARAFDYRVMHLAGEGDTVVIGCPRHPEFEQYCRRLLKLEDLRVACPARGEPFDPLAERIRRDAALFQEVCEKTRLAGGLNIRPYMGSRAVWQLATQLTAETGCPVTVEAPPPNLTDAVNDKSWFASRVRRVLGENSCPLSRPAHSLPALARRVKALSAECDTLCLKLPNSAGSLGNILLDSKQIAGLRGRNLCSHLLARMAAATWEEPFPLRVECWEPNVTSSPSLQFWLPRPEQEDPVLEGIFEQVLSDRIGTFEGAKPAALKPRVRSLLLDEGFQLAHYFKGLGYFGRCSLDAVVIEGAESLSIKWIECNGRWGGTSIPLTLLNRLRLPWPDSSVAIVSAHGDAVPGSFCQLCESFPSLEDGQAPGGVAWLSPSRVASGSGLDYVALAPTPEQLNHLHQRVRGLISV